jgi:hypothetical protein
MKTRNIFQIYLFIAVFILLSLNLSAAFSFSFFTDEKRDVENETQDVFEGNQDIDRKLTIDKIDQNNFADIAILQALNKVTAKTSMLTIKVGDQMVFDKLIIKVHKCWRAPLDQRPEDKILLKIIEDTPEEEPKTNIELNNNLGKNNPPLFYGWMFSSSPSISGLEHPVYDIIAIDCKFNEDYEQQN